MPIWVGGESGPAMRRTASYGDAWYPIGTNPQFPMDTLDSLQGRCGEAADLTEKAGRDPAAVGLAYRVSSHPEAQPKGTVDGERKLFTGGAADYVGDIKALQDVGVTAFDFGLFGPDLRRDHRQDEAVPRRRRGEGALAMQTRHHGGDVGPHPKLDMEMILEAERLGYSQVWTGEAYSTDAVSPAAWILARTTKIKAGTGIMQMPARTPACAAMTVLSLQALSGNRFICGVGPSGPQVIEGWHGVRYGKPIQRTKEYIAIIRAILAREKPLEFHGDQYSIPYDGPDATRAGAAVAQHRARQPGCAVLYRIDHAGRVCAWRAKSPTATCRYSFRRMRRMW